MFSQVADKIREPLKYEPWISGKDVTVNEESNSITVFDISSSDENDLDIPLFFGGVPVIPHNYHRPSLHISPDVFNTVT